ncbi:Sir2 family NAD-dependent protein deacetylase [Fodinibius salsisoli]|uniref:NAD-dependent protein deacylase n=1 Tax=Fodinibius salsisoli TaxID=2820877 RepID=A0ABT3PK89_9BACT|nr:Sir2 family NAD-dependent protein deacetylase [Fodinibius salsisoli]MCW9706163.1 NAD-dependent deacylase [Fodinibius salsisoli]
MEKVIVLTGAGMSADSGLKTFRDSDGLWEGHDIREVATPAAWENDKKLVLNFYNERRKQAHSVDPNEGHKALAELEEAFDVTIITQNVDALHEQADSTDVIHLHGELSKVRSEEDRSLIYDVGGKAIELGDTAEDGAQLRPHVVWFGEPVPQMEKAAKLVPEADVLIVIGTSLVVYPAAGLVDLAASNIPKYIIDPAKPELVDYTGWEHIQQTAAQGTPALVNQLLNSK